jgi:hypothetical protein
VRQRLAAIQQELGVGTLIAILQVATLPADLTEKNLRLFAAEVMPFLRELGHGCAGDEGKRRSVVSPRPHPEEAA